MLRAGQELGGANMKKHYMTGCIAVAAIALLVVVAFDVNPSILLFVLVCPLMMLVMMRMMMKPADQGGQHVGTESKDSHQSTPHTPAS